MKPINFSHQTDPITVPPQLQFQIPVPQGWNNNLGTVQKRKLIYPYIQHILRDARPYQQYVGRTTWTEYYTWVDENNEHRWGADCRAEHHMEKFIVCLVGNYPFPYEF